MTTVTPPPALAATGTSTELDETVNASVHEADGEADEGAPMEIETVGEAARDIGGTPACCDAVAVDVSVAVADGDRPGASEVVADVDGCAPTVRDAVDELVGAGVPEGLAYEGDTVELDVGTLVGDEEADLVSAADPDDVAVAECDGDTVPAPVLEADEPCDSVCVPVAVCVAVMDGDGPVDLDGVGEMDDDGDGDGDGDVDQPQRYAGRE